MQYFIGLTFQSSYLQFQKLDSFRSRYDSKYNRSNTTHLTLVPPFELPIMNKNQVHQWIEELQEEIDGQLHGLCNEDQTTFEGIDFQDGERPLLFLKPKITIDMNFVLELLESSVKEIGGIQKSKLKRDDTDHLYFPIGRFDNFLELQTALEEAKSEFTIPFQLHNKEIVLFERGPKQWLATHHLFSFGRGQDKDWGSDFHRFSQGEPRK